MTRIMVVDDEPEIRLLTRMMLEKEGYEVIEAGNGAECMDKLKEVKPNLILLDVMMPGDDGWVVCRKIKNDEKTKKIPVVTFTVRTSEDSVKTSFKCGADAQINKPFKRGELIRVVREVEHGRHP